MELDYSKLPQAGVGHYERFSSLRPDGSPKQFQADWMGLIAAMVQIGGPDIASGFGMGCEFMYALMSGQLEEDDGSQEQV